MASKVIVTKNKLNAIGDAIREKTGKTSTYTLDEMPVKIRAISGNGSGSGATITITTDEEDFYGKEVALTNGDKILTTLFSNEGVAVFENVDMEGKLTASITIDGETYDSTKNIQTHYGIELTKRRIYGAYWAFGESQAWVRSDDAIGFEDPIAATDNGNGSSPFDNIYPWSEMNIVEDPVCGSMVKIPKFYCKLEKKNNILSIKISKYKLEGYSTCPACMDRGDGKGERDYILVGRYPCSETFKSESNVMPAVSKTRGTFRSGIHNLGQDIWQYDILTLMTIWMLYLVEYANWNSQSTIGCGNDSVSINGGTDNMNYHTGTAAITRGYSGSIQYRNIENLWGKLGIFCDGCNGNSMGVYVTKNPVNFSDSSEDGVKIMNFPNSGSIHSSYIQNMDVSVAEGYECFMFPSELYGTNGGENKYIGDEFFGWNTGNTILISGRGDDLRGGLFGIGIGDTSNLTWSNVGSRLIKLP